MIEDNVILVDKANQVVGFEEKLAAHQQGLLHRAFSIFIVYENNNGYEYLLQQRHPDKYHSGGLWTNTCCSHPRPHETIQQAAKRRLMEEMGINAPPLQAADQFIYRAELDNGLIEHEYDHVLLGISQHKTVNANPQEAINTAWLDATAINQMLQQTPEKFTAWFKQAWTIAHSKLKG